MAHTEAQVTTAQVTAAIRTVAAVGDAIRELGTVPSGELYARLSGRFDIDQYQRIIDTLKGADLVAELGHLIKWIGPAK